MDAGLGDSYLAWQSIQPIVARSTRICAYDRAGLGYSDAGPAPRDSRRIAAELHALLDRAHIAPPYILVGHSFGGFNTRLFAYTWPEEVAGLVLVDVSHEDQSRLFPARVRSLTEGYTGDACRQSRRALFGIERLLGVTAADTMAAAPAQRPLVETLGYRTAWYGAVCEELRSFSTASADEVRRARRQLAIPVFVLDGNAHFAQELEEGGVPEADADSAAAAWHALHRELLAISPQARLIVAAKSSHYVQFDQPDLVLAAIADAVAAARRPPGD
jgi:pimeloyl-ACP methyl ester carboxylesterase